MGACLAVIAAGSAIAFTQPPASAATGFGFGVYVPMNPTRILDTRLGLGLDHQPATGETFNLNFASSSAAVPVDAVAVVVNVTATQATGSGFVTAWPQGQPKPNTSIINIERAGQTLANLVTVPLGIGGGVSLFTATSMHLIADVQGYYASSSFDGVNPFDHAGRFMPVTNRMLDTRLSPGAARVGAGASVTVDVRPWIGGVDAIAAVLKVTVADATNGGYWTVYPANTTQPNSSNINVNSPGDVVPNQVITRLTNDQFTVYSEQGGHLIVDIVGYFTSSTAPVGVEGEFHPVSPDRWLDMRTDTALAPRLVHGDRTVEVAMRPSVDLPSGMIPRVGSVVMNLTVTGATTGGYFLAYPAGGAVPGTSSSNVSMTGQTFANHVITQVSARGFDLYTYAGAYLISDITGYFTGTPAPGTFPKPVPIDSWLAAPGGGSYAFLDGAQTVRWDPCRPVRYRVNLTSYPNDQSVVDEAMKRLSTATGLEFVYVGPSTYMPNINAFDSSTVWSQSTPLQGFNRSGDYEVIIILDSGNASHAFSSPGELGVTQTMFTRQGTGEITLATVMINMSYVGTVDPWSYEGLGPVLMHELGHGVGLGHVPANTFNLMETTSNFSEQMRTYGAGDLYGLRVVGAANGCVNPALHGTVKAASLDSADQSVSVISR